MGELSLPLNAPHLKGAHQWPPRLTAARYLVRDRQGLPKPPDHGLETGEALDIWVHQDTKVADDFRFWTGKTDKRSVIFG